VRQAIRETLQARNRDPIDTPPGNRRRVFSRDPKRQSDCGAGGGGV